jgi:hypothetical protein
MAGRARGIGTHGQRPAEKAGNRGASNYCFGWFHVFTLFVCDWCLVASAPGLRWGETIKEHDLPFYARRQKDLRRSARRHSRAVATPEVLWPTVQSTKALPSEI